MEHVSGRFELPGRWSWLNAAYGDFLGALPESLARQFDRATGDAHVVTCGPAQVGKTTVVLSLLGVHTAALAEVSGVLRAGRTAGRSSTPVPVRYRWSEFDGWGLSTDDTDLRPVSDDELTSAMRTAREAIESGDTSHPLLQVSVPGRYRSGRTGADTIITDLPGLEAAAEGEAQAARALLARYAPIADVVIAVLQADDLGPLLPSSELGQALLPFMLVPERFRVVLTRAAQLLPEGRRHADLHLEGLTAYYQDQFRTHDYDDGGVLFSCLERCLYLFDDGDSRQHQDEETQLRSAVDASLDRLRDSVEAQAVESARFINAARSVKLVHRHYAQRADDLVREADRVEEQLQDAREALENAAGRLVGLAEMLQGASRSLERLTNLPTPSLPYLHPCRTKDKTPSGHEAREAMRETEDRYVRACKRAWDSWSRSLPAGIDAPRWHAVEQELSGYFATAVDCCSHCTTSFPRRIWDDDPSVCVRKTEDGLTKARRRADAELKRRARQVVEPHIKKARSTVGGLEARVARGHNLRMDRARAIADCEGRARHIEEQLEVLDVEQSDALARAEGLDMRLLQAARDKRNRDLTALSAAVDPVDRAILALTILRDQRDLAWLRRV